MNTKTDNTMQDTQLDGMYRMASKFLGYTGPKTKEALEQFRQSSPAVAAKMKRYNNAMAKGGLMRKGYQVGGLAFPEMEVNPGMNRPVNPNDPSSKFYGSGKTEADLRAFYDANTARRTGTRDIQATDGYDNFESFLSDYNAGTGNANLLNMQQQSIPSITRPAFTTGPNGEMIPYGPPPAQQQLGNLRPNMFANVQPPSQEEIEAARMNTSDADLRAYYDRMKAERARTPLSQVVMPLDNYNDFETYLADFRSGKTSQGIRFNRNAQQQPASTGPTPFITDRPTLPDPLPEPPTLEEIPEDATDEERQAIEDRNKVLQDEYAALENQFRQESMDALAQAQKSAVMSTMTPYRSEVAQLQETAGQIMAPGTGQATPMSPAAEAAQTGATAISTAAQQPATATADVTTVRPEVSAALAGIEAATGQVSPEAQVTAATSATTSVSNLEAAQGTAVMMDNPVQREIQAGELISGAADAAKAAQFTEQIEAATATPSKKATVAGQLEGLMQDFEGGETPVWAAGAMRTAMQTLSARGLGASSIAGQAVIQAAMEAALPIAAADAQTVSQFEMQNLSNRQQRAMLAAQQRATFMGQEFDQAFQARVANSARIGEIANMNFTAEQQVALENSRAANTMNLQNLSNRQAKVMAEAAALSQLDVTSLNNRQQAAVQNAQNFMQMDLTNLSNEQQTNMFKAQQNIQSLFTDQAAENAAAQFNAANENQTNQFFAELATQTSQFNASQTNAMQQFNVDALNAVRQFNSEQQQQRDLFNAQNSLIIEQANTQWRQNLATFNTAAQNEANMALAQTLNNLSMSNIDKIWQRERDLMTFAIQTANSNADRATQIAIQKLANEGAAEAAASKASGDKSSAFASAAGSIVSKIIEFW